MFERYAWFSFTGGNGGRGGLHAQYIFFIEAQSEELVWSMSGLNTLYPRFWQTAKVYLFLYSTASSLATAIGSGK
jgi:hypothetical protein